MNAFQIRIKWAHKRMIRINLIQTLISIEIKSTLLSKVHSDWQQQHWWCCRCCFRVGVIRSDCWDGVYVWAVQRMCHKFFVLEVELHASISTFMYSFNAVWVSLYVGESILCLIYSASHTTHQKYIVGFASDFSCYAGIR